MIKNKKMLLGHIPELTNVKQCNTRDSQQMNSQLILIIKQRSRGSEMTHSKSWKSKTVNQENSFQNNWEIKDIPR